MLTGAGAYSGESSNAKRCRTMLMASLASSSAKFWLMQMRGPQLKGMKAPGSLHALDTPSANLPGLNSPGSCLSCPRSRVAVDEHDGNNEHDIRRVRDASELRLLVCPPVNEQRRRVQS